MSTETAHDTVRDTSKAGGFGPWRSQTRAFAFRYVRELFRNKMVLFWTIAFPVGFYLLTITIFMDTSAMPAEVVAYVKAGTAVTYGTFGAIMAALNSFGQQLAMDFEDERYDLYRSLPIAPSADLAGRMIAGTALAAASVAIVLAVSAAVGGSFGLASAASIPIVLASLVAFAVFWMVVAVIVTAVVRDTRYASIVTASLALALFFLTGYNGGDPTAFQAPDWLLNWLPNTLPTRLIIDHVSMPPADVAEAGGLAAPDALVGTATVLGYGVVALLVGLLVMRTIVYKRGVLP